MEDCQIIECPTLVENKRGVYLNPERLKTNIYAFKDHHILKKWSYPATSAKKTREGWFYKNIYTDYCNILEDEEGELMLKRKEKIVINEVASDIIINYNKQTSLIDNVICRLSDGRVLFYFSFKCRDCLRKPSIDKCKHIRLHFPALKNIYKITPKRKRKETLNVNKKRKN